MPFASMVPTVVLPPATPSTAHATVWSVFPVTMAANGMVSPMRTELPEGATFTPFEVDSDAPTFMPPPQPDHRESANNKMTMLLNFTREDFLDPTISESPFLKIRAQRI